jgi:IclR family pca regulon transcriptional regulator
LERGLAILGCFTPQRSVLGIAELADQLRMSRSTTHRYVITLLALGFLEQGASRKYRLGLRVTDLGMSALNSTGLREASRPYLEKLRQRTSYTANLSALDGPEILYVERARSFRRGQHKIDLNLRPGSRLPAYCTAMGKVLLANLPKPKFPL